MSGDVVKVFNYSGEKWSLIRPAGPGIAWQVIKGWVDGAFLKIEGERFQFVDDGSNEMANLIGLIRSSTNFHIYEMHE